MNYKVTAYEKSKGYRVTVSQQKITKVQAENMKNYLDINPYFKDAKIEKSNGKAV
jgi:hypothetical protein